MIYLLISAGLILFIGILFVSVRKHEKKIIEQIRSNYGKVPDTSAYSPMDSISTYAHYKELSHPHEAAIDKLTWNDLDMDDVFRRVDACCSSVGQEYLYHLLHHPSFDEAELNKREGQIAYFCENVEHRERLQLLLTKLGKSDYNSLSYFLQDADSCKLPHPMLYKLLALLPCCAFSLLFISPIVAFLTLCASFAINLLVDYISKRRIQSELVALGYFSAILWTSTSILKSKLPFTDKLSQHYKPFAKLANKLTLLTRTAGSDLEIFIMYFKILFLSDLRSYNLTMETINANTADFDGLFEAIGWLDSCVAIGSFRQSLPHWCVPTFTDENSVSFKDIFHPLLTTPIGNSANMNSATLITGSNASGKSTFIKAVAICGIFAQTIHTCTAQQFTAPMSLVITSMAVRDHLTDGDSYFITEIKSLKRIMDTIAKVRCCCYIDEILKGTNTIERIAASAAVLTHLANQPCVAMVASHDIELTEILSNLYTNYHFSEQMNDSGISFDYLLKSGPATTRNAIKLLDYLKFSSEIITNANNFVDSYLEVGKW